MGFLTPWFLAGAVALGLPVWLHMLRRHKTTPLPFSSLMFFEKRTQSSIKHRRLRYLLLFALRSLLILLLVLAFAHPFITRTIPARSNSNLINVVAIDNSLSMRAGTRLADAKAAAKSLIGGLSLGQRAQVLAFGSRVQVMSEVTDDHAPLNAAIDAIEASDERTSFAELARSARSIAQSLHLPLTVHLFSDMQQTGMPANFNDLRLNADVKLETHPVGKKDEPNFTVENVIAPRRVFDAKKARVLVTVAGYGGKKDIRNVTLSLNDRVVETKPVTVPEIGRGTVEFLSLDVPYGRNKGQVKIDSADAFPADDVFYFSVERADPRPALFVHDADSTGGFLYFKTALEAAGQSAFDVTQATADQAANTSPSKYAFIVLSDVSIGAAYENQLKEYVRGGGSVLVALGRHSLAHGKVPVTGQAIAESRYSSRSGDRFQAAAWLDSAHPSILKDERWDDVKFYRTVVVTPGESHVAAKLTDQSPLLMDQQMGEGHVLVLSSTLDNIDNDFPIHASFVPFVDQTARYLSRMDAGAPSVSVGSFAELRDSKEKGAAVDVLDPKGKRALDLNEATKATNIQFTMAGFWDIRRPNGRNEMVAVNADRHESDLTPATPDTLSLWQNTANGTTDAGAVGAGANQKPLSLWWYVMVAVLALTVAESLLGNQHLSVDKEAV